MSDKDSGSGGSEKTRRRRFIKNSSARPHLPMHKTVLGSEDVRSVTFLSCPHSVHEAVSSFDSIKRNIVESIGFGGLLCMPCIRHDNKKFAVWLMQRLKWCSQTLTLGDNYSITLNPEHIGKISGLSYSGSDIYDNSLETVSEKLSFKKKKLGFLGSATGIVEAAEKFVLEDFPHVITQELRDNFKIAFVIFVMGRFLAPSTDNPDGNSNFWGALQDLDQIASYNWSSYVLSNILDAARLLEWVIPYNKPLTTLAGCPLILEIFYLDNVDFGPLNLPHDILPRWRMFSDGHLNAMIEADTIVTTIGSSTTEFGKAKVIRGGDSCYTFGNQQPFAASLLGLTPPPSINPSPHCRNPKKPTMTSKHTALDPTINFDDGSPLPTLLKDPPNIEKDVLDFGLFIRKKYQGQVDDKFLDDLKLHNAKCLQHLSNSYRSLAADIVNENAKLAVKMIENHIRLSKNNKTIADNKASAYRRRTFNELLSGTESSTEGEDNTTHPKLARTRIGPGASSGVPILNNYAPGMSSSAGVARSKAEAYASTKSNKVQDPAPGHASTNIAVPVGVHPSSSNFRQFGSPCSTSEFFSDPKEQTSGPNFVTPSATPLRNKIHLYNAVQDNARAGSDTPEATIKMCYSSPHVSQTTQNQLFSGACLGLRTLDSIHGIDLNASTFEEEYNIIQEPKKITCPGTLSLSHWEMHLEMPPADPSTLIEFMEWLSTTTNVELDSEWIVHYIPRFLKISGQQLKDQFVLRKPMALDMFDVAIRRIKQLDNAIYPTDIPLRWRHLLESDYAMHVLGSENPIENKSIREQFVGHVANYEICRCRMFIVPVFVECKWWCYAWDLKSAVVFIIDPSIGAEKDDIVITKHSGTILQLANGLESTANGLFLGWAPKFTSCQFFVLRFEGMPYKSVDSGMITLFSIFHFDGRKTVVPPTEANLYNFRSSFLYHLLEIENNGGRKPSALAQS